MQEKMENKKIFFNPNISRVNPKESRPKSSKSKFDEKNIKNIFNSLQFNNKNPIYKLRYSLEKQKYNKNETKLAKILLSNDSKFSIKFHKEKMKENETNQLLLDDKNKLKDLEEKINQQRKLIEEKKEQIKKIKENNDKLKESIKQKETNIENTKKNINDFKKLNEELVTKIENIKESQNNQNNNDIDDSNLDNSDDLDNNFENSREREDAINYLLSMMVDLPQENYPNVDNMTYEELLELEEKIGKVSNGLTDEEIKKLKQEKFIKYKYLEDKCIICQYDFKELENIVVLQCKHCFHFPCIKPWISKQHHCPLCKTNIREEDDK